MVSLRDYITVAYRAALAIWDLADGCAQAACHGDDDETLQQGTLDIAQHYGLQTYPPQDTEMVVVASEDEADICVAERPVAPTHTPTLAQGDALLYSETGYIHMDQDVGIIIAADSVGSRPVKIGVSATKGIVLHGDIVYPDAAFAIWLTAVGAATGVGGAYTTATPIGTVASSATVGKAQ